MAFEFLIQQVYEEPAKRYLNGASPAPGDTICFICTENGTVFKGYNELTPTGENIHAEVEALSRMRSAGQKVVTAITVLDVFSRSTVIPCMGCLNMLVSADYRNINAAIITPTGSIPVMNYIPQQNGYYGNPNNMQANFSRNMPVNTSVYMNNSMSRSASVYINVPPPNPGTPLYMNGAGNVYMNRTPANNTPVQSVNVSQSAEPGSVNTDSEASAQNGTSGITAAGIGVKSYSAGGKKSTLLKNKLHNLLDDDESSEA